MIAAGIRRNKPLKNIGISSYILNPLNDGLNVFDYVILYNCNMQYTPVQFH